MCSIVVFLSQLYVYDVVDPECSSGLWDGRRRLLPASVRTVDQVLLLLYTVSRGCITYFHSFSIWYTFTQILYTFHWLVTPSFFLDYVWYASTKFDIWYKWLLVYHFGTFNSQASSRVCVARLLGCCIIVYQVLICLHIHWRWQLVVCCLLLLYFFLFLQRTKLM